MGKKTNPGPRRGSARPCLVSRIMVTSCLGGSGPVSLSRVTIAGHKLLLRQLRGKLPPLILRTPGLLLSGQGETIICPSSPFRACHVSLGGPIKNAQTPFLSWSGTAAETISVCAECPRCVRQLYSGSCTQAAVNAFSRSIRDSCVSCPVSDKVSMIRLPFDYWIMGR